MPKKRRRKIPVYAIVRIDQEMERIEDAVSVKEIVPRLEAAEAEVERLNKLNSRKGCFYFWQTTRLFPDE